MAKLQRERYSKNVEDKRKARVYPSEDERRSQIYADRQKASDQKGTSHGPEKVDRQVESWDKSQRIKNTNADRQQDTTKETAAIRKQISTDYNNYLSGKNRYDLAKGRKK